MPRHPAADICHSSALTPVHVEVRAPAAVFVRRKRELGLGRPFLCVRTGQPVKRQHALVMMGGAGSNETTSVLECCFI